MHNSAVSTASETSSMFYQSVSEAALLQALQSTLTGEGNATPLSTITTSETDTSTVCGNDKNVQGQGVQTALMNFLGSLSAAQLLMVSKEGFIKGFIIENWLDGEG